MTDNKIFAPWPEGPEVENPEACPTCGREKPEYLHQRQDGSDKLGCEKCCVENGDGKWVRMEDYMLP